MCFAQVPGVPAEHVVTDYVAIGQSLRGGADERVILLVKLLDGHVLGPILEKAIKSEIRTRRTARHVPERVRNSL
jgi:acetoacetyl-CoA synthetase